MKMGRQAVETSRLSGKIAHSRYSRQAFAFNLKKDTEALLIGFRNERVAAAADAKAVLNACVAEIKSDVVTLKNKTAAMMAHNSRSRGEMARESKSGRTAFAAGLSANVAKMTAGFRAKRAQNAKKLQNLLQDFRSDLAAFISDLDASVAEMMGRFQQERAKMSAESQADLDLFILRLKGEVIALKQETADLMLAYSVSRRGQSKLSQDELSQFTANLSRQISALMGQFRKSRADMSDNVKADLIGFLTDLKETVTALKSSTFKMRQSYKNDIADAKQAPVGAKVVPPQKPAVPEEPKPTPPVEPPVPEPIPQPPVEEPWPDDLTILRGIGPSMNSRLRDAGITTFAQLAKKEPRELLDVVGVKSAKFVNVEEWITQAADQLKR